MGDISLCDFPGFDDNRDENHKACASLGLPVAVYYSDNKAIRAVLVVIDYDTITAGRGNELIRNIK